MRANITAKMLKAALNQHKVEQPLTIHKSQQNNVKVRSIKESIIQIQDYDPLEFLGMIMSGLPVPSIIVDEKGNMTTVYENAPISQRRMAAQFLADKMMPTIHAHKIIPGTPEELPENKEEMVESAEDMFKSMVSKAVRKASGGE